MRLPSPQEPRQQSLQQPPATELADAFRRYFTLTPALNDELRRETYRVRHSVYCQDLGWEPVRANGEETDDYDRHSTPCLMSATTNGARVGCLRLVLCAPEDPSAPLPMERACAATIDRNLLDPAGLDRFRVAEVSRLAVTRDYRRRKGESDQPLAIDTRDFGEADRQRFPFIPVGLYLSAFAMAQQLGIEHLLVLTEPRLARHLGRIGLDIRQIGAAIDHKGTRIPSVMGTRATIANLHPMLANMWKQISASMADAFATADPVMQRRHPLIRTRAAASLR